MINPTLPDDLNPVIVEALAKLIGSITGLKPPPTNYFPPEWHGALRKFYQVVTDTAKTQHGADLAAQRNLIIEECARAADGIGSPVPAGDGWGVRIIGTSHDAAKAIRALQSKDAVK